MNEMPLISLIIPCYNAKEEWVKRALNSVRNQTYQKYEALVIDDGSRDECHFILESIVTGDHERLITIDNSGAAEARNTGIRESKGEYVCFLDVDDWLADDYLERAVMYQQHSQADMVIGGVAHRDHYDLTECPIRKAHPDYTCFDRKTMSSFIPHLLGPEYLLHFEDGDIKRGPVARLVKKELASVILFSPDITIGEDLIWNINLLSRVQKVCVARECWYYYWTNPDSVTHKYNEKVFPELEKHAVELGKIIDQNDAGTYRSYISHLFEEIRLCWDLCLRKEKKENIEKYKITISEIYQSVLWKTVCSKKALQTAPLKRKLIILMCRMKLYFGLYALKDKLRGNF